MKSLILRLLLKVRYHVEIEGVEVIKGPFILVARCQSEIDPLLLLSQFSAFVGVPRDKIVRYWVRRLLSYFSWVALPLFSDRAARFFGNRMVREMVPEFEKHPSQNWVVFLEGENNPLIAALDKRALYVATIIGMEGSLFQKESVKRPFGFWKAVGLILQNGIFWMPKRRLKLIFQKATLENYRELLKVKREPLQEVPYVFWKKNTTAYSVKKEEILLEQISRLSKKPVEEIGMEMHLYDDLLLDSLDVTELVVFLEKEFQQHATFEMLETVEDVLQTARGRPRFKTREQIIQEKTLPSWIKSRPKVQAPVGKTLGEAFLRSCDRMGQALASTDPIETLSYVRLKTLAVGLVEEIQKLPGTEVGLLIPASGEMYAIIFALILAGKIPVVLNWSQGPRWMDEVLEQTDVKVVLTTASFLQHLPMELSLSVEEKIVLLEEMRMQITIEEREKGLELSRYSTEALVQYFKLDQMTGDEIAVLLFTSGTEKAPKGVPLSHRNLLSNHRAVLEVARFTAGDVLLGMLPLFHVYGFSLTGIFPLIIGLRVVYHPSSLDFQGVLKQIPKWQVTTLATVPTFLRALLQMAPPDSLTSIHRFIIGAEKPPADLMKLLPETADVMEGYGLTECSPVLTLKTSRDQGVGKWVQGIDYQIVDPTTFQPAKVGLILVRGESVFKGYYRSSIDPFKEIDGKRWFNTQDLGFVDAEGFLHLQGRESRTVKIGGEMISLPVMEDVISQAFKEQVAIIGVADEKKGAHLVLFTTKDLLLEDVNHALGKAGLSPLLKIAQIEKIDAFPLSPMGKIDYKKLRLRT